MFTGSWGVFNFIIGVFGNLLTLVAIPYASRRKRYQLHNNWNTSTVFILNLAVFDLGFCIFGMPQEILLNLGIPWTFGTSGCKIFNFIGPIFAYGDWYALALIALTRCLVITKTKGWQEFSHTTKNVYLLIMVFWAFNIILCVPRFFPDGKEYMFDEYSGICQYVENTPKEFSLTTSSLSIIQKMPHYTAFTISLLIIVASYLRIWMHVKASRKKLEGAIGGKSKFSDEKELRLTITLAIICIFFIICALPLTLLEQFAGKIGYNGIISLFWTQYSINVFVYAARRDQFWKAYQDIFHIFERFFQTNFFARKIKNKVESHFSPTVEIKTPVVEDNSWKTNELWTPKKKSTGPDTSTRSTDISKPKVTTENVPTGSCDNSTNTIKTYNFKIILNSAAFLLVVTLFVLIFTTQKTNNKLLILGGYTATDEKDICSGWLKDVEIIDLERSSECNGGLIQFSSHLNDKIDYFSEDLPTKLIESSGGLLDNIPLVCGGMNEDGETSKSCFKMISASKWQQVTDMSVERSSFSAVVTKRGFLVVGGLDRGKRVVQSVEILPNITENFVRKKDFKKQISGGCMSVLNDSTIILIGGYHYGFKLTNEVWMYDIENDTWKLMPSMRLPRAKHSCTTVKDSDNAASKIIVAGGTGTNSVEIFDLKHQIWSTGPSLPYELSFSQLIQDGIGGGALLVGGRAMISFQARRLATILHLSRDLKEWKQLGRDMKIARDSHVAMMIPENLINCNSGL